MFATLLFSQDDAGKGNVQDSVVSSELSMSAESQNL